MIWVSIHSYYVAHTKLPTHTKTHLAVIILVEKLFSFFVWIEWFTVDTLSFGLCTEGSKRFSILLLVKCTMFTHMNTEYVGTCRLIEHKYKMCHQFITYPVRYWKRNSTLAFFFSASSVSLISFCVQLFFSIHILCPMTVLSNVMCAMCGAYRDAFVAIHQTCLDSTSHSILLFNFA